jgi:hypothetical protein
VRSSCLDLCDFVARDVEILDKNVGNIHVLWAGAVGTAPSEEGFSVGG